MNNIHIYPLKENWNQLEEKTDLLSVPEKPNSIFHNAKKTSSFQVKRSENVGSSVWREARWEEATVDSREEHHTEEPHKLEDNSSAKIKCPPSKKVSLLIFLFVIFSKIAERNCRCNIFVTLYFLCGMFDTQWYLIGLYMSNYEEAIVLCLF